MYRVERLTNKRVVGSTSGITDERRAFQVADDYLEDGATVVHVYDGDDLIRVFINPAAADDAPAPVADTASLIVDNAAEELLRAIFEDPAQRTPKAPDLKANPPTGFYL